MRSAQPNGWQPSPPSPRPPSDRWLRFTPSAAAPLDSTLASELRAVLYWNRILPLHPRCLRCRTNTNACRAMYQVYEAVRRDLKFGIHFHFLQLPN